MTGKIIIMHRTAKYAMEEQITGNPKSYSNFLAEFIRKFNDGEQFEDPSDITVTYYVIK